jgi:hypothetical protein
MKIAILRLFYSIFFYILVKMIYFLNGIIILVYLGVSKSPQNLHHSAARLTGPHGCTPLRHSPHQSPALTPLTPSPPCTHGHTCKLQQRKGKAMEVTTTFFLIIF